MRIPNLCDLLQRPTMFILGAGSTKDYGFPDWDQLKEECLLLLKDTSTIYGSHPGTEHWLKLLSKGDKINVDQVAEDAPKPALELFQSMTFDILLEREARDKSSGKTGWIERFAEKFCNCIDEVKTNPDAVSRLTGNLNFCSLNYERCFPHRFACSASRYIDTSFQSPVKREYTFRKIQNNCRKIYQPHGTLGPEGIGQGLYHFGIQASHHMIRGQTWRVDYGDLSRLRTH